MNELTTTEAGALLDPPVDRHEIVRLIREDMLPAEKRGRDYFIDPYELHQYQLRRKPLKRPRKVKP